MISPTPPIVRIRSSERPRLAEFLGCHGIPDRCPTIGGRRLPICARCTGMIVGYVSSALMLTTSRGSPLPLVTVGLLLLIPMGVDGLRQVFTSYWSTTPVRLVTGWLAGMGQIFLLAGITRRVAPLLRSYWPFL